MKKKLYVFILFLLFLILSVSFWLALDLNSEYSLVNNSNYYMYIIVKSFVLLALLVNLFYLIKKAEIANKIILNYSTLFIQLLPLPVRFLLLEVPSPTIKFISAMVIVAVTIIGYIGLLFLIDINNDAVNKKMEEFKGKEIPVVDEDYYFDKDNKFKGLNKKD